MDKDLLGLFQSLDNQEEIRETYVRAPFGYIGGKSNSLHHILPKLPYTEKYVEVFGGSGVVLLSRKPSKLEVFNDRHSGITAFYRCIRDSIKLRLLTERLKLCLHGREEFIFCRDSWKDCTDDVERGARWWYTIECCFGAQGRNFGRAIKGVNQLAMRLRNNIKLFHPTHNRLKNVTIENLDWRTILKDYDDYETVFYMDPPYYTSYSGSYEHELKEEEHKEMLERIFSLKGFVALSGYPNPMYEKYHWDAKYEWETIVTASAMAETETNNKIGIVDYARRKSQEVLWIKESK